MQKFIPHKNKKHSWHTAAFIAVVVIISASLSYLVQAQPILLGAEVSGAKMFDTKISIGETENIEANKEVEINFSIPINTKATELGISMEPDQNLNFQWENKNRKLKITPQTYWLPQTKYVLNFSNGKNIFFSEFSKSFSFSTNPYPIVTSTLPLEGEKNIAVDIEDPIAFNFNRSLDDFSVKFEVNPQKQLSYLVSDGGKAIKLLSQEQFQWGTEYTISAYLKLKQQPDSDYQKIHEMSFKTAPPPTERSKNPEERLKQALLYTKPEITTGKYIDISLRYQNMVIFENGKALDAYLISTGKRGMETPQGNFAIYNKTPRAWSKKYALFMPYWMAFLPSGQMGIHELPEWPGGYKEGASHLGIPVSHGCVRLGVGSAKRVYEWAEIGTPVVIHL